MLSMMKQNFPYRSQFYLLLRQQQVVKGKKTSRIFLLRMKHSWSNLLVVKIYSMVASRIFVLVYVSTEQFPNYSENYDGVCSHANEFGQHAVLEMSLIPL